MEALRGLGADAATLAQARAQLQASAGPPPVLSVLPECWHAVNVFLGMGTQLRAVARPDGSMAVLGLDYAALPVVLDELAEIEHRLPLRDLMPQLRTMEDKAVRVLNARG